MDKVIVLNISFNNGNNAIYPTLLADDHNLVLVDCGYVGFFPLIVKALRSQGYDGADLTHILITHHDHDHMGCLSDFKKKYPRIKVVASEIEAPYISGKKKSLRLEQAEKLQSKLNGIQRTDGIHFINILRSVEPVSVDIMVRDGDVLPWVGGVKVIATPGHMPGHISLLLEKFNVVVAGDAMVIEDNRLEVANPVYTLDAVTAKKSFDRILRLSPSKIICYHGGPMEINNS
ncbi:MAG TPA: MBL fold metallo-hydrolase [Bacilli bacterium]|nr:MBL fold metallo-hydrolase [Bacilli bacterium]